MGMERYLWSISNDQKVRAKEIREYKITYDETTESFFVTVHGYGFGHGVTVFGSKNKTDCVAFINEQTIPVLRKDGGPGDDRD